MADETTGQTPDGNESPDETAKDSATASETSGSGDASAGGNAAPDPAGETETGFFAEMVGDLLRLDFRTVLAAVFIVLSFLFALLGATGSTLVNIVFLCLPVVTSWLFHNGWVSWTEGDRPKIMFLTFVAGVLCLVGILHMSSFAAGAASL